MSHHGFFDLHASTRAPYSFQYAQELDLESCAASVPRSECSYAPSDSTAYGSVFDRYSVSSVSTAPPRNGPEVDYRPRPRILPPYVLCCEFAIYSGCDVVFAPSDKDEWIKHMCGHLEYTFPKKSKCWFCPEVFKNRYPEGRGGQLKYRARMLHIASHFPQGWTKEDRNQDEYFEDHLRTEGLLNNEVDQRVEHRPEWSYEESLHPRGTERPPWIPTAPAMEAINNSYRRQMGHYR